MKHSLLFILFFILNAIGVFAQPAIQWQKSFGGSSIDEARCVNQTRDGGYIAAGYTYSNDGDVSGFHSYILSHTDMWVIKLDSLGTLQWQKTIGGIEGDQAQAILQTSDGGYFIGGKTHSFNNGDIQGNPRMYGNNEIWIAKLDSTGSILWQKFYGGSGDDEMWSLQITSDGGLIIGGVTGSYDGDATGNHGLFDYWIIKTDSLGVIQWKRVLGGSNTDRLYEARQTADGGFIAVGESRSNNGNVTGNNGNSDCWVVKLDMNGNLQWQKSIGGTSGEWAFSVAQKTNGEYIVSGTFSNDCWLIWLDGNGTILSQRTISAGYFGDPGWSIQSTTDGGFVVGAVSNTCMHGSDDYWIVKFDSNNNIQWKKCLGGSGFDVLRYIKQTTDGGYILAGTTESSNGDVTSNHGSGDFWIVKLAPVYDPLPIELLNFTADLNSSKTVDLKWSTSSETNNDYFIIERSSDANNFEPINFIDGAGNSTSLINYSSEDVNPLNGISYYRLKQTDFDGRFNYSEIISVNNSSRPFNILPNPSDGEKINISLSGVRNDKYQISIYDSKGQEVLSKILYDSFEKNKLVIIPYNKLASGIYLLVISNKNEIFQQKLVVNSNKI